MFLEGLSSAQRRETCEYRSFPTAHLAEFHISTTIHHLQSFSPRTPNNVANMSKKPVKGEYIETVRYQALSTKSPPVSLHTHAHESPTPIYHSLSLSSSYQLINVTQANNHVPLSRTPATKSPASRKSSEPQTLSWAAKPSSKQNASSAAT